MKKFILSIVVQNYENQYVSQLRGTQMLNQLFPNISEAKTRIVTI